MKPYNIFLVRHGESVGNVDKNIYETTPDWKVPLTEKGITQAQAAAEKLYSDLHGISVAFYISPWLRAQQTSKIIRDTLEDKKVIISKYHEDPRLREQGWGNYGNISELREIDKERDSYGTFFYRIKNGESGADVFDRISSFFGTLHRDFEKRDFPNNVIIVSHGIAIRVFLMRWFHWTVEEFELLRNPKNGQIYNMVYDRFIDEYKLSAPMKKK